MDLFKNLHTLIVILSLFFTSNTFAQSNANDSINEITIYTMPTLYPLDWSSPSTLFKSMKNCYLKTITQKDNYLLGHVAVKLKSTLLTKPLLIAQTSVSVQEKTELVLKKKVGFGIMGATLQGRLETEEELNHKLKVYTKRNKLAFIRFKISESAAKKIIAFLEKYSTKMDGINAPCDFYGGAFWPRYENEGAGCSAFGMALLEIAEVIPPVSKNWRIDVNIPMTIIGGEHNHWKKVKNKTIHNSDKWHHGNGIANVDFVKYFVYEPSLMFDWVLKIRNEHDSIFKPIIEDDVPGVIADLQHIKPSEETPIFTVRPEPNLFIDNYLKKIKIK